MKVRFKPTGVVARVIESKIALQVPGDNVINDGVTLDQIEIIEDGNDKISGFTVREWQQKFERLYEQAEKDLGCKINEIVLRPYRQNINKEINGYATAICASSGKDYVRVIGSKVEFDDSVED